jgi:pantoate--beta-alanine ligase
MKVVNHVAQVRQELAQASGVVGLVPTMGALHAGHRSLVERARKECDVVVVSVFVNPTQFNDPKDLEKYPRTPQKDIELLEAAGADIVFMPGVEDIYPEKDNRIFDFGSIAEVMEGAARPGHFNGVGQVVSRLFEIATPHKAYFGEKDYQQLAIIRKLVKICGFDIEIVGCPIVREEDGLAMSSRNMLLTKEQRAAAPKIYAALEKAAQMGRQKSIAEIRQFVVDTINTDPELEVEYFTTADAESLEDVLQWRDNQAVRGFVVVHAGNVRLIDNIELA